MPVALAFALTLAPVAGRADPVGEADRLFREGSEAYARGDYERASGLLDRAVNLVPHGVAYFAAGLAWQQAGDPALAADYFERAIASGHLSQGQEAEAKEKLSRLERTLGRLALEAPPNARLSVLTAPSGVRIGARLKHAQPPLTVRAAAGIYRVVVEYPDGTRVSRDANVVVGTTEKISFTRPQLRSDEKAKRRPEEVGPSDTQPRSLQLWLGVVALGGAAISAGAAGYSWSRATAARDDFFASDLTDRDARARAERMQTWTNIALGSAAVFAATGTVLLLTAPRRERASARRFEVAVGPGNLWCAGAF